jgi:ATP-dependent metalloprotease
MNTVSYTPSLNLQIIRHQLQNAILNCSEALSSFNLFKTSNSKRSNDMQKILVDIVVNHEKYIIDKLLIPLIVEINRNSERLPDTFYESRFGFTQEELLKAQYNCDASKINIASYPKKKSFLFNNSIGNSHQYINKRGFKTRRQLKDAEEEKNTNFFSKMANQMKSSSTYGDILAKNIETKGRVPIGKISISPSASSPSSLDDKIKLAFAEGYLANSGTSNKTIFSKAFGHISNFLWFSFIVYVVFFLVLPMFISINKTESPSGIKFRVNMPGVGPVPEVRAEDVSVRFSDVRGVTEAKNELSEVVDYLKDPIKFTRLGAHLPKGVLLYGSPGTGKTLLAKAVAGEAGVVFFHASGSEFDEMFVGTGAKKIRQLFQAARARAPCVIFIDEIDTVGAQRTNSPTHPYANQTINQLLAEMDGFQKNEGVIVLAATNRPQFLDKALTRPGRFDVQVAVDAPDYKGRIEILDLYLNKIVKGSDLDVELIARKTTGFTGAELANLVNQAALKAALENENEVNMRHIEWGLEKITMGPAKLSKIPDDATNRNTAYHEAGHTLIAYLTKDATPLRKVTIIPRGQALGYTAFTSEEKDQYGQTKSQLLANIDVALGGRIAEELTFGIENVTTGASSDFQSASKTAERMVKYYGMSDKVGYRVVIDRENNSQDLSQESQELFDQEIRRILSESYERTKNLLKTHSRELKALAEALLIYETLEADEIKTVIEGRKLTGKIPKGESGSKKPNNNQSSIKENESGKVVV